MKTSKKLSSDATTDKRDFYNEHRVNSVAAGIASQKRIAKAKAMLRAEKYKARRNDEKQTILINKNYQ